MDPTWSNHSLTRYKTRPSHHSPVPLHKKVQLDPQSPWNHHFPMGFPMVFPWFSHQATFTFLHLSWAQGTRRSFSSSTIPMSCASVSSVAGKCRGWMEKAVEKPAEHGNIGDNGGFIKWDKPWNIGIIWDYMGIYKVVPHSYYNVWVD